MTQSSIPGIHVPWLYRFDPLFKALIWASIILYFIELQTGSENSREGHPAFLWIERCVALVFTAEYFIRLWCLKPRYVKSPFGIIDLLAILPFWAGFFVPVEWLGMVRALRVLRLLKYFRYSRSMLLVALAFYRVKQQLKSLAFAMVVVILFGTVMLFEFEKNVADGKFRTLYDSFIRVTLTTMNCGAIDPQTPGGKAVSIMVFLPAMAIFAGLIGVLSNAFGSVLEEFSDPSSDPLLLFNETHQELKKISELEKRYRKGEEKGE